MVPLRSRRGSFAVLLAVASAAGSVCCRLLADASSGGGLKPLVASLLQVPLQVPLARRLQPALLAL